MPVITASSAEVSRCQGLLSGISGHRSSTPTQ